MIYQTIFENALRRLKLSKKDVKDWRPASEIHIPEIKGEIRGAVIIWTHDGREILFREKQEKHIDVGDCRTVGDVFLKILKRGSVREEDGNIVLSLPRKEWYSNIPEEVISDEH